MVMDVLAQHTSSSNAACSSSWHAFLQLAGIACAGGYMQRFRASYADVSRLDLMELQRQHVNAPVREARKAIDGIRLLLGRNAVRQHRQALPCLLNVNKLGCAV